MSVDRSSYSEKEILKALWSDGDYIHTKKEADDAAKKYAPMLTNVATAVNIRCSGSLGSRSVMKQIQVLLHYCIGNQKLRINKNTLVPSTGVLVVSAAVGAGKNIYHNL